MPLKASEYILSTESNAVAFAEILRSSPRSTEVPDCPGWTLLDLGVHLGTVHRWATKIVRSGQACDFPPRPADPDDVAGWFESGVVELITQLRSKPPESPTWAPWPRPRHALFWSRRQAHEMAMHLRDASRAIGSPGTMDATLAADGVEETIELFYARHVRDGAIQAQIPGVRIVLTERPDMKLEIAGDGLGGPSVAIDATLEGSAVDVLLALWKRESADSLRVTGNVETVRSMLAARITP